MSTRAEYEAWLEAERAKSAVKRRKAKLPDYGVELKPEDQWMLNGPKLV